MASALTVRFRPSGLWRLGPGDGARTRTERLFHSDSLFSAVTLAMRDLGWLDEWIAATAQAPSAAVRLSSCFPFTSNGLLIQPPRTVWPPAQSGKVRWKAARFVPVQMVAALLRDEDVREEQWAVDPVSECVLPVTRNGAAPPPFRIVTRVTAAVDRVTGASESPDAVACLQFAPGAGMWFVAVFADNAARDVWESRIRSAAILLADSGVGGGRSRGWGRSRRPHFERGEWPAVLSGKTDEEGETGWWLVSLFSPAENDVVDWTRGNYSLVLRAGRVESHAAWGDLKPASRLVAEGSVLLSGAPPNGTARNVSDAELPHPVYRSGIALAVPVPWREGQRFSLLFEREAPPVAPPAGPETPEPAGEGEVPSVPEGAVVLEVPPPEPVDGRDEHGEAPGPHEEEPAAAEPDGEEYSGEAAAPALEPTGVDETTATTETFREASSDLAAVEPSRESEHPEDVAREDESQLQPPRSDEPAADTATFRETSPDFAAAEQPVEPDRGEPEGEWPLQPPRSEETAADMATVRETSPDLAAPERPAEPDHGEPQREPDREGPAGEPEAPEPSEEGEPPQRDAGAGRDAEPPPIEEPPGPAEPPVEDPPTRPDEEEPRT